MHHQKLRCVLPQFSARSQILGNPRCISGRTKYCFFLWNHNAALNSKIQVQELQPQLKGEVLSFFPTPLEVWRMKSIISWQKRSLCNSQVPHAIVLGVTLRFSLCYRVTYKRGKRNSTYTELTTKKGLYLVHCYCKRTVHTSRQCMNLPQPHLHTTQRSRISK